MTVKSDAKLIEEAHAENAPVADILNRPDQKTEPTNIFKDLSALRQKSKLTVQRKQVLINVAVGRPANNVYFRTNPDPEMILEDTTVIYDEKKTCYFVAPDMREHSKLKPRLRKVTLRVALAWPTQEILLLPVAALNEDRDFAVWRSARIASELAETKWTQIAWDEERGDYLVETAEGALPEPKWPDKTLPELLILGYAGHVIDSEEHYYVRRLRGLAE